MIDYLNDVVAQNWRNWYPTAVPALEWLLLTNGGTALHDNVVFLGTPKRERQPQLVAKVCRWPGHNQTTAHEFEQLTAVWQQLGSQAPGHIPRPLHFGQRGADHLLLTDYFTGSTLTNRLRAAADSMGKMVTLLQQAASWLRLLHERTARPRTAHLPLSHTPYPHRFAALFVLQALEHAALQEVATAVSTHTAAATTQLVQHGDFWPGNILLRADGQLAFIDWQFSTWTTDPNFDLYFLPLATAVSLSGSGSPEQRGQRVAQQLASWHHTLIPQYLAAYGRPTSYQLLPPRTGFMWACVTAAARPVETFGIMQDDAPLWRTVFAALVGGIGDWRLGD